MCEREVPLSRRAHSKEQTYKRRYAERESRAAKLRVEALPVIFRKPTCVYGDHPPEMPVNIVRVWEPSPPAGEEGIEWLLMTNEPIDTPKQVEAVIDWYRRRWKIEEYFKALKTGCAFERRQIQSRAGLVNTLALLTPIAWQLLTLRDHGRKSPNASARTVLSKQQLSRRDAMEVVGELLPHPAPPSRTVVTAGRPLPQQVSLPCGEAPAPATLPLAPATAASSGEADRGSPAEPAPSEGPHLASRRAEVVPLNSEERRLHLTVSKRFVAKLTAAADALAHTRPGASEAELLEAGLDLLLARAAKRYGLVDRPRKAREPANPDHVPAAVKRAVYLRDGGRCQYRLASGEICGCTRNLEYDHDPPLAKGGKSTVDGVRLACRPHNLRGARRALGDAVMDRYTSNPRTPRPTKPPLP